MDYFLFSLINGLAARWPALDMLGIFFARGAIFLLPLFSYLNMKSALLILARMVASATLAFSANALIGLLYMRPRPFTIHDVNQLISLHFQNTKSFPSDHTAIAFAVATTVCFFYPRAGIAALITAALIGIARVFVGVHYPFDILAGAVVGACSAIAIHFCAARLGIL